MANFVNILKAFDKVWCNGVQTKVKEIFQEKLEIEKDIITEHVESTKWRTIKNNTAGNKISQEQS